MQDAAQWLTLNCKNLPFITYDEVLGIQIAPTEYTAIVNQGSGVLALDHLARTGEYFTEDGIYDESMPNPDFLGCCNPEFNHYGFEHEEFMRLIRELRTQTGYFDKTGASYTTPALEILNRLIKAHWTSYDPSLPAGAPSTETCVGFIKEQMAKLQIDLSEREIQAINLITRHPTAKGGNINKKIAPGQATKTPRKTTKRSS